MTVNQREGCNVNDNVKQRKSSARRGISLIEVLMSIFILSVGLLGLASLIPVGGYQVGEAIKSDRAAAVGRAAFNEVRMRGLLDRRLWRDNPDTLQLFVIDPLGNDQNGGFKGLLNSSQRIQLRRWPGDNTAIDNALIRHIFTSHDDLIFVEQDNPDDPPRQMPATGMTKRPSADQYSWLVTVVPAGSEGSGTSTQGELHRVSVAVFYSRQPNDETAEVPVVSASVDGGTLPFGTLVLNGATTKHLESLKDNRWIFITNGSGVNRWYKIMSRRGSRITVDGPQIEVGGRLQVVLFKDVVGVYEHAMKLDSPSLWAK
jgi:type II secretory pathway pseudopilin PulG